MIRSDNSAPRVVLATAVIASHVSALNQTRLPTIRSA